MFESYQSYFIEVTNPPKAPNYPLENLDKLCSRINTGVKELVKIVPNNTILNILRNMVNAENMPPSLQRIPPAERHQRLLKYIRK